MSETRTWILYRHRNQNMKLITGRDYQVTFWVESELSRVSDTYHPVEYYEDLADHEDLGVLGTRVMVRLRAPRNSAFPDHVFPINQAPEAGMWPLRRFLELYESHPRSGNDELIVTKVVESVRG